MAVYGECPHPVHAASHDHLHAVAGERVQGGREDRVQAADRAAQLPELAAGYGRGLDGAETAVEAPGAGASKREEDSDSWSSTN
jgi:hypothetical protein